MGLGRLLLGVLGLPRYSEMEAVLGAESGGRGAGVAVRHDSICPRERYAESKNGFCKKQKFDKSSIWGFFGARRAARGMYSYTTGLLRIAGRTAS